MDMIVTSSLRPHKLQNINLHLMLVVIVLVPSKQNHFMAMAQEVSHKNIQVLLQKM
jgi:hypothetical protein